MKLARCCVRYRALLMILFALATGWAFLHFDATPINYDLTRYLSEDTDTARGLRRMNAAFQETSSFRVALSAGDDAQADQLFAEPRLFPRRRRQHKAERAREKKKKDRDFP